MENMNLSDKSREALKSETWQELREDMKEEIVSEYLKNGYADEESPIDEAPNETEKAAEDFKEKACDKLREELKKADDKQFADPVIGYLLKRCGEDNGLAQDVMQKHKTWEKCSQYIFEQARKQAKGGHAAVRDDVVYEWAEDYYHKDDKAEEEKKAKQEAEAKARRERAAANRKTSEKKLASQEAGTYSQKEKTENKPAKEQAKPKKNGKELEGQMDLFSMMDMLGGGSDE